MKILEVFEKYNPEIINRPYVIAEAGVNHEGDIEIAKRLIDEAARGAGRGPGCVAARAGGLLSGITRSAC